MTDAAPEPAETAAEPVIQGSEHIQERGEEEAAPEAEPEAAPVDHKGLLHELAAHIRTVAASAEKDVTELLAFLASHGL